MLWSGRWRLRRDRKLWKVYDGIVSPRLKLTLTQFLQCGIDVRFIVNEIKPGMTAHLLSPLKSIGELLFHLGKQSLKIFRRGRSDADELQILFDVLAAAHADERGGDAGRGANELDGRLRVGRQRAERVAYVFWKTARDLALKDGCAGDDRHAEGARSFQHGDLLALQRLIVGDESFGHGEVERKLYKAEAVRFASDLARNLDHTLKRMMTTIINRNTEAVPRRHAIHHDPAFADVALQRLKRRAQAIFKFCARDC